MISTSPATHLVATSKMMQAENGDDSNVVDPFADCAPAVMDQNHPAEEKNPPVQAAEPSSSTPELPVVTPAVEKPDNTSIVSNGDHIENSMDTKPVEKNPPLPPSSPPEAVPIVAPAAETDSSTISVNAADHQIKNLLNQDLKNKLKHAEMEKRNLEAERMQLVVDKEKQQEAIAKLQTEKTKGDKNVEKLRDENKVLEETNATLVKDNKAQSANMENLKNELGGFKTEGEKHQETIDKLLAEKAGGNKNVEKLQEKSQVLEETIEKLVEEKKAQLVMIETLKNELEEFKNWKQHHQQAPPTHNSAVDGDRVESVEKDKQTNSTDNQKDQKAALEEMKNSVEELEQKVEGLEQEKLELQQKVNAVLTNNEEQSEAIEQKVKASIDEWKEKVIKLEQEKCELQQNLSNAESTKDAQIAQVQKTINNLRQKMKTSLDEWKLKINGLEQEKRDLEQKLDLQSTEDDQLAAKQMKTTIDELTEKVIQLTEESLKMHEQVNTLPATSNDKDQALQTQETTIDELTEKVIHLTEEKLKMHEEVNALPATSNDKDQALQTQKTIEELKQKVMRLTEEKIKLQEKLKSPPQPLPVTNKNSYQAIVSQMQKNIDDLKQQTQEQSQECKKLQETLSSERQLFLTSERQQHQPANNSNNDNDQVVKELKKTIDELKQKFMGLVEEKLQLQVTVDSLEHQFVEVDLDLGNDNKKGPRRESKLGTFFSATATSKKQKKKEEKNIPPPIVVDETTKQGDILKQTLALKKEKQWGHRLSGVFAPAEQDDRIDAKMLLRQMSLEYDMEGKNDEGQHQMNPKSNSHQEAEDISPDRHSWSSLSKENLTESMLDGMTLDNVNQGRLISPSIEKDKKPPTTWLRFNSYIQGENESNAIDYGKLMAMRDSSAGIRKVKDKEVMRSLFEPDSMLEQETRPVSSIHPPIHDPQLGVAVQMKSPQPSAAHNLNAFDVHNSMLGDNIFYQNVTQNEQTSRNTNSSYHNITNVGAAQNTTAVSNTQNISQHIGPAPAVFATATHNPDKPPKMVGEGREIDQSNLLDIYVRKREEKTTSTFNYLTNLIYGDDEEDIRHQDEMLQRQLRKKKQEDQQKQKETEELLGLARWKVSGEGVPAEPPPRPRTMLSGNI